MYVLGKRRADKLRAVATSHQQKVRKQRRTMRSSIAFSGEADPDLPSAPTEMFEEDEELTDDMEAWLAQRMHISAGEESSAAASTKPSSRAHDILMETMRAQKGEQKGAQKGAEDRLLST